MKPIRYQTIGGVRYRICDLGCDDLELAKRNREMVAQNRCVEYWVRLENQLEQEEQQEIAGVIQVRRR